MPYQDGSFGADLGGRHIRLFDAFIEKQAAAQEGRLSAEEAMSVSDFQTYVTNFSRKTFLGTYDEVQGQWAQFTHPMPLDDFEEYTSFRWGRFPDWPQRTLNADVENLAIKEYPGPKQKLVEWAAGFALTRQLVLADRLGKLLQLPAALGDAGSRTQSKRAVSQLEANPTMFDGVALFHASHANIGSTALTADIAGANAILAAFDSIDTQTDDEGFKIVNNGGEYVLIVPRGLQQVAFDLRDRENLPLDATSGTSLLRPNPVRGRFTVVVERFLTDANNWYMALNPTGPQGFLAALNLNGATTPSLFQKDEKKLGLLGSGEDPYTWRWDQLEFLGRHDFEYVPFEFRTVYGAIVA